MMFQTFISSTDLQDTDLRRRMTHIRVALVLVRIVCRVFHMTVSSSIAASAISSQDTQGNVRRILAWLGEVSCSLQHGACSFGNSTSTQSQDDSSVPLGSGSASQRPIADNTPIRLMLHSHITMIHRYGSLALFSFIASTRHSFHSIVAVYS